MMYTLERLHPPDTSRQVELLTASRQAIAPFLREIVSVGIAEAELPIIVRPGGQLYIGILSEPEDAQHSSVRMFPVNEGVDSIAVGEQDQRFLEWWVERIDQERQDGIFPNLSEDLLFIRMNAD